MAYHFTPEIQRRSSYHPPPSSQVALSSPPDLTGLEYTCLPYPKVPPVPVLSSPVGM